jgi:hypothetical protein
LEDAENGKLDDSEDYSRGYPLDMFKEEKVERPKPCIGLCYYFRQLGIPNPHVTTTLAPDPEDSTNPEEEEDEDEDEDEEEEEEEEEEED